MAKDVRDTSENGDHPDDRILTVEQGAWNMIFDEAVNLSGSGTRAILISPDGQYYSVAVKHKACILDLQAAIKLKFDKLRVFGDSTLIIL